MYGDLLQQQQDTNSEMKKKKKHWIDSVINIAKP